MQDLRPHARALRPSQQPRKQGHRRPTCRPAAPRASTMAATPRRPSPAGPNPHPPHPADDSSEPA